MYLKLDLFILLLYYFYLLLKLFQTFHNFNLGKKFQNPVLNNDCIFSEFS